MVTVHSAPSLRVGGRGSRLVLAITVSMVMLLALTVTALAHEERTVSGYDMEVGFIDEPVFVGQKSGLEFSAGLACAAAGALGSLVVGSSALTGAAGMNPLEYAFATQTGLLLAIRALGAGVGAIVVTVLLRRGQIGNGSVVAGVVGAGCLALIALGSHAAASEAIGPVVADVVHLGAGAIWLSGLAGLVLLSRAKLGPTNAKVMQTAVPRFSALALASIGLVAASGLYAAWLQVGSLDETGRQRFPFEMTPGGLAVESGFTPNLGLLVGIGLLLGAVVGLAYWTGGGSLPRTARETGRPALLIGGIVGLVLGAAILLAGPVT